MRYLLYFLCVLLPLGCFAENFDVQVRAAYFYAQDSRMRDILCNGWCEYQIEANYRCNPCYTPWINFTFYDRDGHSSCEKNYTQMVTGSLKGGAKKYFSFCCSNRWRPYIGVGLGVDYVDFFDKAEYVDEKLSRWCPTIIAKSGIEVCLACCLFADLFLDYSYTWFAGKSCREGIKKRDFNTGGLHAGIGIGTRF